ncbi:site-specific recombinase XerD [Comamonas sp. BIGb0124]|uniref:tyrosine-type recombinase/integrase n=1 Tax=Comamonas sp. BIGb0124 TaxID=2485130 RepID=UPI000F4AF0BE|nr:site-specific integrase [Comamonas sp. BIGb0124]ROR21396.1 site-specific recombinase XerD [Comamonas sp. BIGb0124]
MATPKKTSEGTWRVQMQLGGQRLSSTFATKREADDWIARSRMEAKAATNGTTGELKTLSLAMTRYAEEVTTTKRGWRAEGIRINAIQGHTNFPGHVKLSSLTPDHLAAWRDSRLKVVSRGSVLRDMNLISSILNTARREWRWINGTPMSDVRRPQEPDHREVVISRRQIVTMLRALDYATEVRSIRQAVAMAFVAALLTGMRAGELCALAWEDVKEDHCVLKITKNGRRREVPLSTRARLIFQRMRGWDDELVFGLTSQSLDAMFRKYRARAGLSGFTFHDSRHTAATHIAGRLRSKDVPAQQAVMDLCKMFGWTRMDQALVYYNPRPGDIASRRVAPHEDSPIRDLSQWVPVRGACCSGRCSHT